MLDNMEKEADAIRNDSIKLSWYMRGGISYDRALMLSTREREMISNLVKENMETTKKSGLPFF